MACLSVIIGQQTCKSRQAQMHRILFNMAIEGNMGDVIMQQEGSWEKSLPRKTHVNDLCAENVAEPWRKRANESGKHVWLFKAPLFWLHEVLMKVLITTGAGQYLQPQKRQEACPQIKMSLLGVPAALAGVILGCTFEMLQGLGGHDTSPALLSCPGRAYASFPLGTVVWGAVL